MYNIYNYIYIEYQSFGNNDTVLPFCTKCVLSLECIISCSSWLPNLVYYIIVYVEPFLKI